MQKQWDVLGLGVTTVDDTLYVESYPQGDTKNHVLEQRRRVGGLTAAALIAAARLGGRCAYAGMLGHDDLSRYVEAELVQVGVDMAQVVRDDDAQPTHSTVIVGQTDHTRTIFGFSNGRVGAADDLPPADVIRSARVLFVDTSGRIGTLRAARIAHEAGIPIVGDFERDDGPHFDDLLALVDHLILGQHFALNYTQTTHPAEAARKLAGDQRAVVIVTCGVNGCWFQAGQGAVQHQPAYPVEVVDTNGCGDVFHGAYALALAQALPLPNRVRFASAVAALKATQPGLQNIPHQRAVNIFLAEQDESPDA